MQRNCPRSGHMARMDHLSHYCPHWDWAPLHQPDLASPCFELTAPPDLASPRFELLAPLDLASPRVDLANPHRLEPMAPPDLADPRLEPRAPTDLASRCFEPLAPLDLASPPLECLVPILHQDQGTSRGQHHWRPVENGQPSTSSSQTKSVSD